MTTVQPTTPSSNDGVQTVSYDLNKYDYEQYYHCFFDQHVPEGRCVGIQLLPVPNDHIHSLHSHQLSTQSSSSSSSSSQLHWLFHYLHPEEIQYGLQLHHMNHRQSFYMGRLAIRHALQQPPPKSFDTRSISSSSSVFLSSLPENGTISTNTTASTFYQNKTNAPTNSHNFNSNPTASSSSSSIRNSILKDMYGRPKLPYGYLGSISHKGLMGVALVQEQPLPPPPSSSSSQVVKERPLLQTSPRMGIGVDIEDIRHAHRRRNVARKVLTPHEIQNLGTLSYQYHHDHNHSMISTVPNSTLPSTSSTTTTTTLQYLSVEEEILLRFSCKESVYKAIHPLLNQYVSFQEAEIQPYINGTALVTLHLAPSTDQNTIQKHEQQFQTPIIVHWYRYENYIITTASICLQE